MLFSDAIKAKLPLVSVTTRDLMNFREVVNYVTGKVPVPYKGEDLAGIVKNSVLYYVADKKDLPDYHKLYAQCIKAGSTLLLVNPRTPVEEAFDAGELSVPPGMMRETLEGIFTDKAFVASLLPTVGGLSLKELGEVVRLTEVRDGAIGPAGITKTRAILVPDLQGFSAVQTSVIGPYLPQPDLEKYAEENKYLFLKEDTDPRLVPKGALFDGETGTGKTAGAKWLARQWGIPLYRLDSSILNKYYGESENNLKRVFNRVGQEAPCILLIDEAEKLFGRQKGGDDSMMGRMLGLLLWQMQESEDRVFVLMTSNNKKILPPELYREGRIDMTITFIGLSPDEAKPFAEVILKSFFSEPHKSLVTDVQSAIVKLFAEQPRASHSAITEAVKACVKRFIVKQQGG